SVRASATTLDHLPRCQRKGAPGWFEPATLSLEGRGAHQPNLRRGKFEKRRAKTAGRKSGTPNTISSMLISAEWRSAIFEHFKDHKQECLDLVLKEFPDKYAEISWLRSPRTTARCGNSTSENQTGQGMLVIQRVIFDPKRNDGRPNEVALD